MASHKVFWDIITCPGGKRFNPDTVNPSQAKPISSEMKKAFLADGTQHCKDLSKRAIITPSNAQELHFE